MGERPVDRGAVGFVVFPAKSPEWQVIFTQGYCSTPVYSGKDFFPSLWDQRWLQEFTKREPH
jgi:hypothetical protein